MAQLLPAFPAHFLDRTHLDIEPQQFVRRAVGDVLDLAKLLELAQPSATVAVRLAADGVREVAVETGLSREIDEAVRRASVDARQIGERLQRRLEMLANQVFVSSGIQMNRYSPSSWPSASKTVRSSTSSGRRTSGSRQSAMSDKPTHNPRPPIAGYSKNGQAVTSRSSSSRTMSITGNPRPALWLSQVNTHSAEKNGFGVSAWLNSPRHSSSNASR